MIDRFPLEKQKKERYLLISLSRKTLCDAQVAPQRCPTLHIGKSSVILPLQSQFVNRVPSVAVCMSRLRRLSSPMNAGPTSLLNRCKHLILVCRAFKEQAARVKKMNMICNNHVREYIKVYFSRLFFAQPHQIMT